MASNIFSATTTGASGQTTIQVYTKVLNSGSTKSAVLSVDNGNSTETVSLAQYFKPTISRSGSGIIPSSGGSLSFSVSSPYQFFFRNTPSNVSDITAGGQSYISGNVPAGNYNFSATISANGSTATTSGDIEMAFQRLDGNYSYSRPDASDFKFSFSQSGSTTPIGLISISTPANVAASATTIPYSVTANMQSTIIAYKNNVSYNSFNVQSGTTSGNLSIAANSDTASPITYRFEGTTSDNQGFATATTIQSAAEAPVVSGNTINVPVYFEYDGTGDIYITLGEAVPFQVTANIQLTYFNGNNEMTTAVIPANSTSVVWTDFRGNPIDFSIFNTIQTVNYASITNLDLDGQGAEASYTFGNDDYYLYWSEEDSSNFRTYMEAVGNNSLNEVTWGTPPAEPIDYTKALFTIEALSAGTLSWAAKNLEYVKNASDITDSGATMTAWNSASTLSLNAGDKISFITTKTRNQSHSNENISFTGAYKVYGNIMSLQNRSNYQTNDTIGSMSNFAALFAYQGNLVDASNLQLPATTLKTYCYENMFKGCTSLVNAPALPATSVLDGSYQTMFSGCTSLANAPALPATTIGTYCYARMFEGCSSLTSAPELPATTMAQACYQYMFYGCTSLTTAPVLNATSLADSCYYNMFNGCTSLVNAPALPATSVAARCYYGMFNNCVSLTTAPDLNATSLWNTANNPADCYAYMFQGCSNLNYIKCLMDDYDGPSEYFTLQWVNGVAATGTFVRNPNRVWPVTSNNGGIPNFNWTVIPPYTS